MQLTNLSKDGVTAYIIRLERNKLLSSSDWTQVADAIVNQSAWASYRSELRNLPQQAGFPNSIVWPTKPV